MKLIMQLRADGRLVPSTETDQEEFEKLRRNNHYKVQITKARNPEHHNKGMRLIRDVFENQDTYQTMEDLMVEFKLRTGWYTEHITMRGVVTYIPKSLDFASMDQTDFEEFYGRAIDVAVKFFGYANAVEYLKKREPPPISREQKNDEPKAIKAE